MEQGGEMKTAKLILYLFVLAMICGIAEVELSHFIGAQEATRIIAVFGAFFVIKRIMF